jgi:hypothetical protein
VSPSGDYVYQPLEQEDRADARSSCCAGDAAWKKAHARGMGPEVATNLRTAPVFVLGGLVLDGERGGAPAERRLGRNSAVSNRRRSERGRTTSDRNWNSAGSKRRRSERGRTTSDRNWNE